jgi:hypothetical protein
MNTICEEAELKAEELRIYLGPQTRAKLSTYDDDTQVRWIANPMMEQLLQYTLNQILAGKAYAKAECLTCSPTVNNNNNNSNNNNNKSLSQPEPVSDEDEPLGMGLFD